MYIQFSYARLFLMLSMCSNQHEYSTVFDVCPNFLFMIGMYHPSSRFYFLDERFFCLIMVNVSMNGSMDVDGRPNEVPNNYGFFVSPDQLEYERGWLYFH